MSVKQLTDSSRPHLARGDTCVLVVARSADAKERACLESLFEHTLTDVAIVVVAADAAVGVRLSSWQPAGTGDPTAGGRTLWVAGACPGGQIAPPAGGDPVTGRAPRADDRALTAAIDGALAALSPADIALIAAPCRVSAGWLGRMREAAWADTNTASASALADTGTPLALFDAQRPRGDVALLARELAENTLRLRPRLNRAVGPCIHLRRDALELIGSLDRELPLTLALEIDFAQRCLLSGLAHVAADDVLVEVLAGPSDGETALPAVLRERYPFLSPLPATGAAPAASSVLPRALHAARRPHATLDVTIDARALDGATTGTQRHILELIRALTATEALRARLLTSTRDEATMQMLRSLPHVELLPVDAVDEATPRSTIFHRPQQVFETQDLRFALRLGERIVVNQLDLIAYRNPGYHRDTTAWQSHRRITRQALAAAERIVVFSEHTRLDLLSDELADGARVHTVPPGLDHPPERERAPDALRRRDAGDDREAPFLLCLGTDFRHKNRLFALRILEALRERHGWTGRLILAGTRIPHGSSRALEEQYVRPRPSLREALVELGAVDEQEKNWLMSRAAAVVYPSVYEGFGLVPFEAARSGVPCIFAARSSLAEVLPAEAATVVPWDPEQSAARVLALLEDADARTRHIELLAAAGRELTWRRAAEATVDVYREAVLSSLAPAQALSRDELAREHELRELIAARDALVERLATEREHAKEMYDRLNAEVGSGLSLIGPRGSLPDEVQRSLLALSAHPLLSRPLYGAWALAFRAARASARATRALFGRGAPG